MNNNVPEKHVRADGRPDPEALLKRYNLRDSDMSVSSAPVERVDDTERRGRLRVYLGSAAGVGKTYAMLNEGRRRKERGTDVVIGYVETHKRPQTQAQIADLETLPRKKIQYRGVTLEEMDTDAILARHPEVVLIDELAHTNVAGSKHLKRYQDVEELLDTGIDVVTTLNVQHLESLNDLVASITGIQVRETLPDRILDQADEVELIDIAPYALRQRMKHGNIYPPERIDAALNNFFREGNLTALREIALRRTAEKTESQLQQYLSEHGMKEQWATNERVLVGFDHRPQSRQVIRDAWRLAHGLHADFIALSVELTGYPAFLRDVSMVFRYGHRARHYYESMTRGLKEHALLAEDLGAEVMYRTSSDIASALVEVAQQRHITQIVLGQPARSHWEEFFYSSVVNRLLRLSVNADIHLVPLSRQREERQL